MAETTGQVIERDGWEIVASGVVADATGPDGNRIRVVGDLIAIHGFASIDVVQTALAMTRGEAVNRG